MDSASQKSPVTDPDTAAEDSVHVDSVELNPIPPSFHVDLQVGRALVRALLGNGASGNFISDRAASELKLRRHRLHERQSFTAASGESIPCTQFAHIYVRMHTVKFYLSLRVAPMHPDLILSIPFLTRFNPVINWQLRSFRVQRDECHHWIHIVYKHDCY